MCANTLSTAERTYSKPINMQALKRTPAWKLEIAEHQRRQAGRMCATTSPVNKCPVCDSGAHELLCEVFGYLFHECSLCGHVFNLTPPAPEATKGLYCGGSTSDRSVQSQIYARADLFQIRVESIATPKVLFVSERLKARGVWVDLGAGVGEIVVAASRLGWQARGVESDPDEIAFGRSMGAAIDRAFLQGATVKECVKGALVVSLVNVLEHIADLHQFLGSLEAGCDEGMHLLIEVPRHPSLSSLSNMAFPEYTHRHICPPEHLHVFTEESLGRLIEAHGFMARHVWLFGQDVFELMMNAAIRGKLDANGFLQQLLATVSAMQECVDRANLSDTMLVLAEKCRVGQQWRAESERPDGGRGQ